MSKTMKSAYELALERMAERGIDPPDRAAIDDSTRDEVESIRQAAAAGLAELEILHKDRLANTPDPESLRRVAEEYVIDRRRIEERRDSRIARLRRESAAS